MTFDLNYDTEPEYDVLAFRFGTPAGYQVVDMFNGSTYDPGSSSWQPLIGHTVNFTVDPEDLDNEMIVLEFLAQSDASGSDEDCGYPTAGFAQVDNIVVSFADKGVITIDDFEGGAGAANWQPVAGGATGGFAAVWPELNVLPGCTPDLTPQVAFVDPTHDCVSWCYGPDANTVIGHGPARPVRVAADSWADPAENGAEIAFDVYRHFPMGADYSGLAYVWYVRSVDTGDPDDLDVAPWRSYGLAYTGTPGFITHTEDVSTLLVPNRTHVQLALGVRNIGPGPVWGGADTTPAPYYDNVSLTSYGLGGPAISARDCDLGQDNFPAIGVIDYGNLGANAVRFDAAVNTTPGPTITPRSEIRVEIVPAVPGALVEPPLMHYLIEPNPLFVGERGYPTEGTVPGAAVVHDLRVRSARRRLPLPGRHRPLLLRGG